ncbi:Mth938-like domain-containing protein [Candidatus Vallotia tarda]|uniref:Mth938-like domain-containing protein n=1 Tax=Candidatus Vallotiella hemipterorum TaxID=1177213 RepID=UPI001FE735E3|nr:Mth938-like domain-containing protein [Candidatus Vallotia tarda]
MKLHLDSTSGMNTVTGYGDNYVDVNRQRYDHSIFIFPQKPVMPWPVSSFDMLTPENFDMLVTFSGECRIEVVIFGTSARPRFVHPRMTGTLAFHHIGIESMSFHAACRTYNILVIEERKVALALLIEKPLVGHSTTP